MKARVPALLMLLGVTAGLFTMHTIGHHGGPAAMPMGHAAPMTYVMDQPTGMLAANMPADDGPAMPMGSLVLCVAILCGLAVIALATLLRRTRASARDDRYGCVLRGVVDPVRGPPKIPAGLAITDLSVLRN